MSLLLLFGAAATVLGGDASPQLAVVQRPPRIVYNYSGDDFAPQQPTFVSDQDENVYQVAVQKRPTRQSLVAVDDEFAPPQASSFLSDEDESGQGTLPQRRPRMPRVAMDDEEFPTLSAPAAPDAIGEYAGPSYRVSRVSRTITYIYTGDDFPQLSAPASGPPFEEDWQPPPLSRLNRVVTVWTQDDDLPQQPAVAEPEGIVWLSQRDFAARPAPVIERDDFAPPQGPVVVNVGPAVLRWIAMGIGSLVEGGTSFFRHSRQNRRGRR